MSLKKANMKLQLVFTLSLLAILAAISNARSIQSDLSRAENGIYVEKNLRNLVKRDAAEEEEDDDEGEEEEKKSSAEKTANNTSSSSSSSSEEDDEDDGDKGNSTKSANKKS